MTQSGPETQGAKGSGKPARAVPLHLLILIASSPTHDEAEEKGEATLHNLGAAQVGDALPGGPTLPGGPAGCIEHENPNLLTQLTLHLQILWR